ncbi:mip40 [Drosophila busckii]|uniref:Mip40 n=1 Tax=Drosophila busckii TaxID=30019 RepID=A0A0M4EI22_DROBS|nr:protein lin-37 homolog [Drosophila busckii]ALC40655.1 mip40 [Drosophila busckii]
MKVTPKKTQRSASGDSDAPLPMLQMDDDVESELPIRGRPSKKLLLQKQQQRSQFNVKLQTETKSANAATASREVTGSGSGRSKAKRSLYKKHGGGSNSSNSSQKGHSESYVMRLFERSLDLSKYKEMTPLYPICRAWMANQPRNPNVAMFNTDGSLPSVKREDNADEVLAKLLSGELKVLKQLPQPRKTELPLIPPRLSIAEDSSLKDADKDKLLAENMSRWKQMRSHWIKHTQAYERERYEVIDQIMDAVCKRE